MCQAIFSRDSTKQKQDNPSHDWKDLSCFCCQAAGGDYSWAQDVSAAWFLYHQAARLMDNVEDNDASDNALDAKLILSAATGLFFTAQLALSRLSSNPNTKHAAGDVSHVFTSKLLKMCEGQHQDIIQRSLSLEQYWQIAEKKSGNFFSIASYCGAALATADHQRLSGFEQYGFHLGLLIQLLDDLEDIYLWMQSSQHQTNLNRCLPFVYALEVIPETEKNLIKDYLIGVKNYHLTKDDVIQLLEQSGAVLYLSSEIERHSGLAIVGLEKANALPPASNKLQDIIKKLTPVF